MSRHQAKSGKLLETAAAQMPEPPTSEAMVVGLWSIQNDSLGGLTYPLTFNQDVPNPTRTCWFQLMIKDRSWSALTGSS